MKKNQEMNGIGKFISFFEIFFNKIDELELIPSEILKDLKFLNCDYINNCLNPRDIHSEIEFLLNDLCIEDLLEEL
jgi:hypothetical protein